MSSSIERVKGPRWPWLWGSSPLTARMQAGVGFNLLGAAFNQGSTLIVNLAVANFLGTEAFGHYTMVLATIAAVATLGQLSMGYTATKYIAEFRSVEPARTSRILGLCAVVSTVSALVVTLGLALAAGWLEQSVLGAPGLGTELRLAAAAVFFTVMNGFFTGGLAGLEAYSALARAGLISGTVYVVICLTLARSFGLPGAVVGVTVSSLVQFTVLGWLLVREGARQGVPFTYRGLWSERAILTNFAFPASLAGLLSQPALWIASALLARQPGGYHQLGLFGAANSFRTMVLFVPQVINNVGMSLLNNQQRSDADAYRRVFWMNASWTIVCAFGMAGVLFIASEPLLGWFGPTFIEGRTVLRILLGAAMIEAVGLAAYQIVVSRARIWASLLLISLPRDLTLVLTAAVLTPMFGATGLASAYAVAVLLAGLGKLGLVTRLGLTAPEPTAASLPSSSASGAMNRASLRVATGIYRATPFRPLREAYFRTFVRLVRGRRVVRTVEGMTFELDLGELIDVGVFLERYERDVVGFIERLTRPGWTVLDIGANMGAHTLRFSKLVGPGGRVFAFEPMEYAFEKLARNVSLNDATNTQPFRLALSDRNADAQRVSYRSSWALSGERRAESAIVDFRCLDDWCAERRIDDIHVIKLDVDGQELQVLKGGLATIERCRPVLLVEIGAWHFASPEGNPLRLLASRGYRFWETTTLSEMDLTSIRARLPERDDEMTFSINLVAATEPPLGSRPAGSVE